MGKRLPVPPELEYLIEKREAEKDRRRREERGKADRRGDDNVGPLGAIESADTIEDVPAEERRSNQDRRKKSDRRGGRRRKSES
jgi:hypothetical protein